MPHPDPLDSQSISQQAATWVARRDRGLSAAEQDEYAQWLAARPEHTAEMRRHLAAFERMMRMHEWQPGASSLLNPDLFRPPRRRPWWRGLAAALVLMAGLAWWVEKRSAPGPEQSAYLKLNETRVLADGTRVELKDGARLAARYTAGERRVVLFGEAHFDVAKEPGRGFIVEAGGARVRAVGTAFNVRLGQEAVEVLVTEGVVEVEGAARGPQADAPSAAPRVARVEARHRAVIPLHEDRLPAAIPVTEAEMLETLAWKAPRLHFTDTPLAVAVAEFNRRNRLQIVIADPAISAEPIGGTFQVNNVEGFVRLLEVTLEVRAERRGTEILLRRAP